MLSVSSLSMVESFVCLERNYTCWTFLKSGMFPWRLPFFCYFFYILDEGVLLFDCLLQQGFLMYAFVFALETCLCWCWFVWYASLFLSLYGSLCKRLCMLLNHDFRCAFVQLSFVKYIILFTKKIYIFKIKRKKNFKGLNNTSYFTRTKYYLSQT